MCNHCGCSLVVSSETKSNTKRRTGRHIIVLQYIIGPPEDQEQDMQEDNEVEQPVTTLVDHPQVPALLQHELQVPRIHRQPAAHCRDTHESLHAVTLRHVPLEVRDAHVEHDVRVRIHVRRAMSRHLDERRK